LDIEADAKNLLLPNKAAILSEMGFYSEAIEIYNSILRGKIQMIFIV